MPKCDKISEVLFLRSRFLLGFQVFPWWTVGRFENLRCLRKGLCRKCDIWLTIGNNLGLANALSYNASHRVYDLWITLLFHLFFGATSLETESRSRVLVCSLLIGDAKFVFLYCIGCIRGSLKCRLSKEWRELEARYESLYTETLLF